MLGYEEKLGSNRGAEVQGRGQKVPKYRSEKRGQTRSTHTKLRLRHPPPATCKSNEEVGGDRGVYLGYHLIRKKGVASRRSGPQVFLSVRL